MSGATHAPPHPGLAADKRVSMASTGQDDALRGGATQSAQDELARCAHLRTAVALNLSSSNIQCGKCCRMVACDRWRQARSPLRARSKPSKHCIIAATPPAAHTGHQRLYHDTLAYPYSIYRRLVRGGESLHARGLPVRDAARTARLALHTSIITGVVPPCECCACLRVWIPAGGGRSRRPFKCLLLTAFETWFKRQRARAQPT